MSVDAALAVTAAIVAVAIVCGLIVRARDGRRRSGGHLVIRSEDLDGRSLARSATLLQFSTELCARCPQVRRMLGSIADEHAHVAHVEIDLTNRNDLATRYHVLQTPTTFLVDASGTVLSRWGGVPSRSAIDHALGAVLTPHTQESR